MKRILVIDDEPDIREIVQVALEDLAGWQVFLVGSGAEGIQVARAERPDAILLDVMMPDLDGPATLRLLKGDPETERIPVILLTAKIHPRDLEQTAGLGAKGTINKPFEPMTLAGQVAAMLSWPSDSVLA